MSKSLHKKSQPRHDAAQIPLAPAEAAARIRRAARALAQKVRIEDLGRRGFTHAEIDKARRLLETGSFGS